MVTHQEVVESISNGELHRYQSLTIEVWTTDMEAVMFRNVEFYELYPNERVREEDDVMLDSIHIKHRNGTTTDITSESISVLSATLTEESELK